MSLFSRTGKSFLGIRIFFCLRKLPLYRRKVKVEVEVEGADDKECWRGTAIV